MTRKLVLASAGAGKSRLIVEQALRRIALGENVLILTYTEKNQEELRKKIRQLNKFVPSSITVKGWFTFLLEDMIRPYQSCIFGVRIPSIHFNQSDPHKRNGKTIPGRKEKSGTTYKAEYFLTNNEGRAHTTYLSKLAVRVNGESKNKPIERLSEIYGTVYVDEVQDLTGWDFDILGLIAKSDIGQFCCVGDFRQTIYTTHITRKQPRTNKEKLERFARLGLALENLNLSWRCIQAICDFADLVHEEEKAYKPTKSQLRHIDPVFANHLGLFVVSPDKAKKYLDRYQATILRVGRSTQKKLCERRAAFNFGEAKGMGFDRVLICATEKHRNFLSGNTTPFTGDKTAEAKNKFYVAITRARYSVAFLYDGDVKLDGIEIWDDA